VYRSILMTGRMMTVADMDLAATGLAPCTARATAGKLITVPI
jgi:hypothetical protein